MEKILRGLKRMWERKERNERRKNIMIRGIKVEEKEVEEIVHTRAAERNKSKGRSGMGRRGGKEDRK